jgi:Ca2+/Na+ antiporter
MKKKVIYYALAFIVLIIAVLFKFHLLDGELKYLAKSFALTCVLIAFIIAIFDNFKKPKKENYRR